MEVRKETGSRYPVYNESPQSTGLETDDAYLYLNCEDEKLYVGTVSKSFNGWTPEEYYGFELSWPLNAYLTQDQVNELLEKVAPEAEKVIDGYYTKWDGHNTVGCYDDDAGDAIARIDEIVDSYSDEYITDWNDFWDWFSDSGEYKVDPELEVQRIGSEEDPYPLYHEDNGKICKAYLHFDIDDQKLWVDRNARARYSCGNEMICEISPYLRYDQINELLDMEAQLAFEFLDNYSYWEGIDWGEINAMEDAAIDYSDEDERYRDEYVRWLEKSANETTSQ